MKKLLLPIVAALAMSACTSITEEQITINSSPEGALVMINDEIMGVTPLSISLPKSNTYEVTFIKEGYKNQTMTLASLRRNDYVKFGPLVDMGYYKKLTPSCEKNEMTPNFIPAFKGTKAFDYMQRNLDKVDLLRKDGKISEKEHSYMLKKIIEFYSEKK